MSKYYWYSFRWRRPHSGDYQFAQAVTTKFPPLEVATYSLNNSASEEHQVVCWKEITKDEFEMLDGEL